MNPDLLLSIVTALAGFVLKTALAFGFCLILGRLVNSPTRRFMIWAGFLYGAAAYWLWLASTFLTGGRIPVSAPQASVPPATPSVDALQIPGSWALPLGVALRILGICYLLALGYILFTQLKKQRHLKWVLRFTTQPPAGIAEVFLSVANRLHVSRSRLLVLPGVTSPATFGWIRPTILLPDTCLEQDPSELEDVLCHELHHVRRWDFCWNGFALVCRALLFFHPGAWYAVRKMQFDRELACDLAVVSHSPARRAEYAECLVRFARLNLLDQPNTWGIDFAASAEHLKARVHSILAGSAKPSAWLLCLRMVCGVTLLAGFLGIVPSLAVLLSYTHPQILKPLTAELPGSHSSTRAEARTTRRVRLLIPAAPSADATAASVSQTEATQFEQPMPDVAARTIDSPASSGSGPKLVRRPQSSTVDIKGARQQTVALVDPSSTAQGGKTADRNQTLQQTATAAADIYRRLSVIDRH